jgi:hypothetical protein
MIAGLLPTTLPPGISATNCCSSLMLARIERFFGSLVSEVTEDAARNWSSGITGTRFA